jgi:membrane-associated protein
MSYKGELSSMIESVAQWLTMHGDQAPLLVFGLLLLTGFSFPVSEDVIVIASGVLAATVIPERTIPLFVAVYTGSFMSDWIAYWIGRLVGKQLVRIPFFHTTLSVNRRETISSFFQKYGFLTLFIGRLIPFGIRNSVFMAAGAGKMHFGKFLLSDGVSCLLFSSTVFYLSFRAGENYKQLHSLLTSLGLIAAAVMIVSAVACYAWFYLQKRQRQGIGDL